MIQTLSSPPAPWLWTREEYQRLAELGFFGDKRVELIEGQVVHMSPMNAPHKVGVMVLSDILFGLFRGRFAIQIQCSLYLSDHSQPEPDAAILPGSARDYCSGENEKPLWVVEVAETSLPEDRTSKAILYASAGIPEYWIINLVDRQIEVMRSPSENGYTQRIIAKGSEKLSPLIDPDAKIAVEDLLP